ncbi:MAG: DUF2782 domain-containing protein [Thermomonas sp.]|uniref:DUF2782 domain-containing protein n=1 Tax=Thermomonas sp. TaxID=1971895 RepID=UPI001ED11211|nr:DUF2782 domain-containing protein [Thermomonas sp.]MBV2209049.1 DUF2782 domain-containing protein [Thermomonas sp.]
MRIVFLLSALLALAACATVPPEELLAKNTVQATRTEANGDVITEYRNGDRLSMVKVTPKVGVAYYIYDRNGDGKIDAQDSNGGPLTYYKLFSW